MVTGDSILTAAYVSREVGILQSRNETKASSEINGPLLIENVSDEGKLLGHFLTGDYKNSTEISTSKLRAMSSQVCITGEAFEKYGERWGWTSRKVKTLLGTTRVYARMTPSHKESLVIALKNSG
mmetsp:Transcript_10848/g.16188  ORF Transcript_10848/g.16188 Transcript_10848/m.16188 type:complete len:125 (+) Transcript_10848:2-376(+)